MKLILPLLALLTFYAPASAATFWVRADGGNGSQCLGTSNAAYDGSGSSEPCAFNTLQLAVNACALGDTINLRAGDTFNQSIYLPDKGAGTSYITIQSTSVASLPDDIRVSPANVALMAKLVSDGSGAGGGSNQPVVSTDASAHHYKFIGIEMTPSASSNTVKTIFQIHGAGQSEAAPTLAPHHIIIDRCYLHSAGASDLSVIRGVTANGKFTEIRNSYISDIHGNSTDAQAIFAWDGPGELIMDNDYLEATSEVVQIGYGDPAWTPNNVSLTRSHLTRPLSWRGNANYGNVKNLFEMKGGTNVTVTGNVFENNWADGQDGHAIVFSVYNNDITNVTFSNNLIRHVGAGFGFLDDPDLPGVLDGVTVSNNLIHDLDPVAYENPNTGTDGGGYFISLSGSTNLTLDHNTESATGAPIAIQGNDFVTEPGFTFTNNISGTVNGITIMMTIFNNGGAMHKNVRGWIGGHSGTEQVFGFEEASPAGPEPPYPQVTMYNSLNGSVFWFLDNDVAQMGFQNFANHDFRLAAGSLYKAQGDGGTDVGVIYPALVSAIGASSNNLSSATIKAITGNWADSVPGATVSISGKVTISGKVSIQ